MWCDLLSANTIQGSDANVDPHLVGMRVRNGALRRHTPPARLNREALPPERNRDPLLNKRRCILA
eukprot:6937736-Prymnesium_polylepis.1